MALKFTKLLKFTGEVVVDWTTTDKRLPYIILGKAQAIALKASRELVWQYFYGAPSYNVVEKTFKFTPPPEPEPPVDPVDVYYWFPFQENGRFIPPLCDGCIANHFSIKWLQGKGLEEPVLDYATFRLNKFEDKSVENYFVVETFASRELVGANEINIVQNYRILLYTSNY